MGSRLIAGVGKKIFRRLGQGYCFCFGDDFGHSFAYGDTKVGYGIKTWTGKSGWQVSFVNMFLNSGALGVTAVDFDLLPFCLWGYLFPSVDPAIIVSLCLLVRKKE